MLICDLRPQDRAEAVDYAAECTQGLWPSTLEGRLAHGVFVQLLKDLGHGKRRDKALEDWHGADQHWWMEGFGVGRPYLWNRLNEWGFVGEGLDLEPHIEPIRNDHIAMTGTKTCRLCKEDKDVTMFHIHRRSKDGRTDACIPCRRAENNGYNNNV